MTTTRKAESGPRRPARAGARPHREEVMTDDGSWEPTALDYTPPYTDPPEDAPK